ncbi:MAG: hypothetical protein NTY38_17325 [Acidobacteria bacterium]|nr:hypothetical protein [Acidobacteriota bacterium]
MLSNLTEALDQHFDVFICSASYEERCRSVPDAVSAHRYIGKRLVCFNQKSSSTVTGNAKYLLGRLGRNAHKVPLDKTSPLITADNLQRALSHAGGDDRDLSYLVDITTFTHEALLILLRLLQARAARSPVVLAYAPAAEYSVGLPPEEKWLSKGITDIRSVLGYPGDSRPSRKSHLIVLVGFESDRAERLLDEYQPHVISLGFGQAGTATSAQNQHVNRLAFGQLASKVSNYGEFEFSCVDVSAVENAIAVQASKFPDCNVVIAPMNTKLSTVGVAGAAFRNEEIQLCYASASQYNVEGYSRPGDNCILTALSQEYWKPAGGSSDERTSEPGTRGRLD